MVNPAPFSNVPTQDEIARRQKMAQALMGQAVDASPVGHWTQAIARVVKGGVGGMWDNQARQGQQDRQSAVMKALSGSGAMQGLNDADKALLVQNPEMMQSVATGAMGRKLDPNAGINRKIAEAKLKNLQRGPTTDWGKQGAIFQGKDGNFYTVQFASDGRREIKPVATADGTPLEPAKGVGVVGDEMYSKASGAPVRNVGDQIRGEQIAKGEGQDLAKTAAELPEAKVRLGMIGGQLDRLKSSVKSVMNHKGLERIVGNVIRARTPDLTTDAVNAATELDNLKVKISGQVLQSMREMSKTGGAVGQVTEREWPRLENMLANLDRAQSVDQFKKNLSEVLRYVDEVKGMMTEAYRADVAKAQRAQQLGNANRGQYTRVAPQSAPVSSIPPPPQPAQAAPAARPVPPQAAQMLQANPTPQTKAQFDEIFGPGAADRVLGGQ